MLSGPRRRRKGDLVRGRLRRPALRLAHPHLRRHLLHLPPPAGAQHGRAFGIALLQELRLVDAVGAEAPEVLPQLAPADHQPHALMIADRERPDGALARPVLFVAVADADLAARADA